MQAHASTPGQRSSHDLHVAPVGAGKDAFSFMLCGVQVPRITTLSVMMLHVSSATGRVSCEHCFIFLFATTLTCGT